MVCMYWHWGVSKGHRPKAYSTVDLYPDPRIYKVEPPNSGLQNSYGVDYRALRGIYVLDPPRALGWVWGLSVGREEPLKKKDLHAFERAAYATDMPQNFFCAHSSHCWCYHCTSSGSEPPSDAKCAAGLNVRSSRMHCLTSWPEQAVL